MSLKKKKKRKEESGDGWAFRTVVGKIISFLFQIYNNQQGRMKRRVQPRSETNSQVSSQTERRQNSKNVHFAANITKPFSLKNKHRSESILKKENRFSPMKERLQKKNSLNSLGGYNTKEDQICQSFVINKVVKQQYNKLIQDHSPKHKFIDDIFPPNISSLFSYPTRKLHNDTNILWKRIPEVFPHRDLVLMSHDPLKTFLRPSTSLAADYFCLALNCLKNNRPLLKRIFQFNKISKQGLYCLKIFQTNVWKNIIIDDYIPVVQEKTKKGTKYMPVFLTGEVSKNTTQPIQIWPYLLEKAYAKFYSNYESLQIGNVFDFLEEISNETYQQINIQTTQLNYAQFFKIPEMIILGEVIDGPITPIYSPIGFSQKIFFLSTEKPGNKILIKPEELPKYFNYIYVFGLTKYSYVGFCPVKQAKQSISVRSFTLKHSAKSSITLVQKDEKFFKGKVQYEYSWVRLILLQKQFGQGYRWIDGRYENFKSIFLQTNLQKGEYYVLIMPEWKIRPYDMSLFLRTKAPTILERKANDDGIFEEGCADLAQRFGRMNQLNQNICSYNCIHEDLGLIIENINNEKHDGDVKINRSIEGLEASLPIVPFNKEFKKDSLSIVIRSNRQYTVVLMMKGGIDKEFFLNFDFGCK